MRGAVLVLALLLAGCTHAGGPSGATVEAPTGGGPAVCHSQGAEQLALDLRGVATNDSGQRATGIYRLASASFLYVWADYHDTLRQDKITRIASVDAYEEPDRTLELCAQLNVATPTQVDGVRRTYAVAARLDAPEGLPNGTSSVRVVVNWVAGCPCSPLPTGNATADFT